MLRVRTRRSLGHIEPCLPSPAERPPAGSNWIHEIKHDGFRIMARRDGAGRAADYTRRKRLLGPLPVYRSGGRQAAGSLLLDRRRGHRVRRERARRL